MAKAIHGNNHITSWEIVFSNVLKSDWMFYVGIWIPIASGLRALLFFLYTIIKENACWIFFRFCPYFI